MATVEQKAMKFVQSKEAFEVKPHPQSNRLYHIEIKKEVVKSFLDQVSDISVQRLEYVPYMRHIVANTLETLMGENFRELIRSIIHDRESGGFTIGVQGATEDKEEYVKFGTALAYIAGIPNFDAMSGKYYARFTVKDTDNSDSYLRQAYRTFTLHTDGTFVNEPTDWLIMMKMHEENAKGGESRLLHLDDWDELDKFANDPLGSHQFTYKAPASKNVDEDVLRTTFFKDNNKHCICFIDQFVYPETVDQAKYLQEMSESLENDDSVIELELPVGDLVLVNNLFWMHGRAAFEKDPNLNRELMRLRGRFTK
ncbi:glutarate dioxygenase GlaH [Desertibacillus haloalkaliphilus]|uniref:glutarate dioxygenase GlaH n=1 Tax=Desertibacillus haloalkaliphilus TaxID=1328930 RepID=UPI001C27C30F|nr:glutarate dioxygenase GlaH [Desertibacillus haloalkaliphilus]MBU8906595.1 carbon starvation induced protein CsiD [Desertibacillus haloalkaliphilus]